MKSVIPVQRLHILKDIDLDEFESVLDAARKSTIALLGDSHPEPDYCFDTRTRTLWLDLTTPAGMVFLRILSALLSHEFGSGVLEKIAPNVDAQDQTDCELEAISVMRITIKR